MSSELTKKIEAVAGVTDALSDMFRSDKATEAVISAVREIRSDDFKIKSDLVKNKSDIV
jgi:phenylpyruvate tautomerase PptA (4-oxalocrotonate tautomerase family)